MITENPDGGGYKFAVSYHFESNMRTAGERSHPTRVKRLAQEAVTLCTALPLSYSSSVFVRCDADRLDVMKVSHLFCNARFNPAAPFKSVRCILTHLDTRSVGIAALRRLFPESPINKAPIIHNST